MLSMWRKFVDRSARRSARQRRGEGRPLLECLEDRVVPSFTPPPGSPISLPNVTNGSFQPHSVVAADLNGDGIQDLALGSALTPGAVAVLTGNGNGTFQSPNTINYGNSSDGFIRSITAADLSGSGKPDLIAVNASAPSATVTILQNTTTSPGAAPTFTVLPDISVGGGNILFWVTAGDLVGDGKPDLVVANLNGNSVNILPNTSSGPGNISFGTPLVISLGTQCRSVVAVDLDGDNKLDLVTANFGNGSIGVIHNTSSGPGNFSFAVPTSTSIAGSKPSGLAVGDFNGDGKPDIAAADFNSAKVYLLLNQGGSLPSFTTLTTAGTMQNLTAGDFNGDGKADLAVSSSNNNIRVLYGDGNGAF